MASISNALIGGALIGAASAGLLLVNGRVAGISGILGGAIRGEAGVWRWTFVLGLIAAGFALPAVAPYVSAFDINPVGSPTGDIPASVTTLAISGVLVGFGTALGTGCTSGHGVSGISNLSPRSLVATLTFIGVAAVTVFIVRHLAAGA
ncbi:YeeE/YedE family protein [Rhodomicrobium sp.]|uniref:YeeE/YedE family protein n=1 Tax=Rhodomicrobium sp. TaxID=2720632 RepID=UPI0039E708E0